MRLAIASDHAGYDLKEELAAFLARCGHQVEDLGTHSTDPVDFPDITRTICERVTEGQAERAVIICGTGVGACIAANKISGIRAALCHDVYSAHQSVEHDDVNVLCLGAQIVGEPLALDLLRTFLDARFSDDEQFRRRVQKLNALDTRNAPHDHD